MTTLVEPPPRRSQRLIDIEERKRVEDLKKQQEQALRAAEPQTPKASGRKSSTGSRKSATPLQTSKLTNISVTKTPARKSATNTKTKEKEEKKEETKLAEVTPEKSKRDEGRETATPVCRSPRRSVSRARSATPTRKTYCATMPPSSPLKRKVSIPVVREALQVVQVLAWLRNVVTQLESLRPEDVRQALAQYSPTKEEDCFNEERHKHVELREDTDQSSVKVNTELYKQLFEYAAFCRENNVVEGLHLSYKAVEYMLQLGIKRVYVSLLKTHLWSVAEILEYNPKNEGIRTNHVKVLKSLQPVHAVTVSDSLTSQLEHILRVKYIQDCVLCGSCEDYDVILEGIQAYTNPLQIKLVESLLEEKVMHRIAESCWNALQDPNSKSCLLPLDRTVKYLIELVRNLCWKSDFAVQVGNALVETKIIGVLLKCLARPEARSVVVDCLTEIFSNEHLCLKAYSILSEFPETIFFILFDCLNDESVRVSVINLLTLLGAGTHVWVRYSQKYIPPEHVVLAFLKAFKAHSVCEYDLLSDCANFWLDRHMTSDVKTAFHFTCLEAAEHAKELLRDEDSYRHNQTEVLAALRFVTWALELLTIDARVYVRDNVVPHIVEKLVVPTDPTKRRFRASAIIMTAMKTIKAKWERMHLRK